MISFTTFNFRRRLRINAATTLMILGLWFALGVSNGRAQAFSEGWNTAVPGTGWVTQNNSIPVGSTGWFQGNTAVFPGQTSGYIGANFNNTTGTNTISNWLISPNRTFSNGDVIKFWTRTITDNPFPDRLQVRMSLNGTSTNVGTGPVAVGDFTTLLYDINPTYDATTGPPPGMYPDIWTEVTLTISGLAAPTSGRIAFRYFVEFGGPTGDNSNYIGIDTFSYTPAGVMVTANGPLDYNGDGRTDYVVTRNVGGGAAGQLRWYYNFSSGGATNARDWGLASDFLISGNWDTDANDDIAVWRPGAATVAAFYILRSSDSTALIEPFGQTGDDPTVVADYTGDGRTDFAVYRGGASPGAQSTWYYRSAATPGGAVAFIPWGLNGDFPVPGDIDGNGSADFTIQRNNAGAGNFWTRLSTGAVQPVQVFGTSTDLVVPGDYDADGKTDLAVARGIGGQIVWFWRRSSGGGDQQVTFGAATDDVAQGDYNGDGRTDVAIWRAGTFWVRDTAAGGVTTFALGASGDYPVANFNSH